MSAGLVFAAEQENFALIDAAQTVVTNDGEQITGDIIKETPANTDVSTDKDVSNKKDILKENSLSKKEKTFKIGIGYGIPYGLLGFNVEGRVNNKFSLTGGFGAGWAVGGIIYFRAKDTKDKIFRPRLSLFYGAVGLLERQYSDHSDYEKILGNAVGVGFEYGGLGFDLMVPFNYKVPEGATGKGGSVFISIGYHF